MAVRFALLKGHIPAASVKRERTFAFSLSQCIPFPFLLTAL